MRKREKFPHQYTFIFLFFLLIQFTFNILAEKNLVSLPPWGLEMSYGFSFALRNFITSCCLSPSTSANLRLNSEYLSCISISSSSMTLFFSFSSSTSLDNSSRCLVLDAEASMLQVQRYSNKKNDKDRTHSYFW